MNFFTTITIFSGINLCFSLALTINEDTIQTPIPNGIIKELRIEEDLFYLLSNQNALNVTGDLINQGRTYVTNLNKSLSSNVTVSGKIFFNEGTLVFDATKSDKAACMEVAVSGAFQNYGNLYFGVSGRWNQKQSLSICANEHWYNKGTLILENTRGSPARVGIRSSRQKSVRNAGVIFLKNVVWTQETSIEGNGCIVLDRGSSFHVKFLVQKHRYFFSVEQIIYMKAKGSAVYVYTEYPREETTVPVYRIFGFGYGKSIHFNMFYRGHVYDSTTGILSVTSGTNTLKFDVGFGYSKQYFQERQEFLGWALYYLGEHPNDIPDVCTGDENFFDFLSLTQYPKHLVWSGVDGYVYEGPFRLLDSDS